MENTREEEEEKLHKTTLNYKMEKENYPKPCISLTLKLRGVFINTRRTGARGQTLARPRQYGRKNAAIPERRVQRSLLCGSLRSPISCTFWISDLSPLV